MSQTVALSRVFVITALLLCSLALCGQQPSGAAQAPRGAASQQSSVTSKVTLDSNETLFSVLTAINACGYDQELNGSDPARQAVRAQITEMATSSSAAQRELEQICAFYRDHQQGETSPLAAYISLALSLGPPPKFEPTMKEADLPPDASYILGFVPLLRRFSTAMNLHRIWQLQQPRYEELLDRAAPQVANTILNTDVYLKIPVSGYLARRFIVYMDLMGPPSKVNARNYGSDYFLVLAPERGQLKLDPVRHTYLHFVLDTLVLKRANALRTLEPLLVPVKLAPLDEVYKNDIGLLVTECLIRAVELRINAPKSKEAERQKEAKAQESAEEGFILTPFFNERLAELEKGPESLQDAFGSWLREIDVAREKKRANQLAFKTTATPDVLSATRQKTSSPLDDAENRLHAGDLKGAEELSRQVLKDKSDDPGRAMFVLAQVAAQSKNFDQARQYFEDAVKNTASARIIAWSNIYLGRMYDLARERETALEHYKAALEASARYPGARSAAEKGIQQPYTSPVKHDENGSDNNP